MGGREEGGGREGGGGGRKGKGEGGREGGKGEKGEEESSTLYMFTFYNSSLIPTPQLVFIKVVLHKSLHVGASL